MLPTQHSHHLLAQYFDGLRCAQECPGRLALLLGSIYLFLVGFFTPGCSFTGLLLGSLYGLPAAFCAIATLSTLGAAINYCLSALLIKVTWCGEACWGAHLLLCEALLATRKYMRHHSFVSRPQCPTWQAGWQNVVRQHCCLQDVVAGLMPGRLATLVAAVGQQQTFPVSVLVLVRVTPFPPSW